MNQGPWQVRPAPAALGERLAHTLALHPVAGAVLAARGFTDRAAVGSFFAPTLDNLHDPMLMPGMGAAVTRLLAAARSGEHVLVYGDYDVDGVCGTILLRDALTGLGARVSCYIPHRLRDGYGLHESVLTTAAANGVSLVVTVDTGVGALAPARRAQALGLDLIITDHHALPPVLPTAAAVVHPQIDDVYPDPHLAGAGVALKVVQALAAAADRPAAFWTAGLDLAALATIADIVPLTGENRILTYHGLRQMRGQPRPGVDALLKVARLSAAAVTAEAVSFQLAPRLNAAGRLGHAALAMDLLTADGEAAPALARQLEGKNKRRRRLQDQIYAAVREWAAANLAATGAPAVPVVAGDAQWHRGVLGIVAGRLADEWGVPVLLAQVEDGLWRGSARSVPGFDIVAALATAAPLLAAYGGHEQAAGFTVAAEHATDLAAALARAFAAVGPLAGPAPLADAWAPKEALDEQLANDLERLQPCGPGNPSPLLASRLPVTRVWTVGANAAHLKLTLTSGVEAIAFGQGHRLGAVKAAGAVTALHTPVMDTWQQRRLQLRIEELVLERPRVQLAAGNGTTPPALDRNLMVGLYRLLRDVVAPGPATASVPGDSNGSAPGSFSWEDVCHVLASYETAPAPTQAAAALDVFLELGLIRTMAGTDRHWLLADPPPDAVELTDSPTFRASTRS